MSQPRAGPALWSTKDFSLNYPGVDKPDGITRLTDAVQLNLVSLQQQVENEREEVGRRFEHVGQHVDARLASLEARLSTCEQRISGCKRDVDDSASDGGRLMREARSLVNGASSEVQALCRSQCAELEVKLQELIQKMDRKADDVGQQVTSVVDQLHYLEAAVTEQAQAFAVMEQELTSVTEFGNRSHGELADRQTELRRHFGENRQAFESQLAAVQADAERSKHRSETMQQDLLAEITHVIQEEVEQRIRPGRGDGRSYGHGADVGVHEDFSKRVVDIDSKIAKLRVRVDLYDGRISSLAERVEAATHEAQEGARQAVNEQRNEIMTEVDCQIRILRQRLDAIGELCEELSLHELT